uniref:Uncharacterized protein n=1 Tax=Aegilops tauschii TaxID=37682 RepID=M8C388_AEGTA
MGRCPGFFDAGGLRGHVDYVVDPFAVLWGDGAGSFKTVLEQGGRQFGGELRSARGEAVRSSPAFRRRFRELHPAPLLGVFLDIYGPAMPVFVPVRRRSDPDHATAVRGADVFLTHVPDDEGEGEGDGWVMTECRGGYVVLFKQRTKRLAVYDPLTRGMHLIPAPPEEVSRDPESALIEFHVVTSEEDRRSFQVVCVCMEREEVQVAAFSPDSSEWQISPEAATPQLFGDEAFLKQAAAGKAIMASFIKKSNNAYIAR